MTTQAEIKAAQQAEYEELLARITALEERVTALEAAAPPPEEDAPVKGKKNG